MKLELIPFSFGLVMATIDVFMLSIIKKAHLGPLKWMKWMIVPTVVYALQPWIFLESLQYESLIVMNLMWDLLSDILVSLTGFFYFGERLGPYKTIGVVLSFLSIILMSIQDGTWEDFLGFK